MGKKVIVKNPKDYNLTKDQEYDVIEEDDNFVKVLNDNGTVARYSKDLVDAVNEAYIPTLEEFKNAIYNMLTMESRNLTLGRDTTLLFGNQQTRNRIELGNNPVTISERDTNISCGVVQVYGINVFNGLLLNANNYFPRFNSVTLQENVEITPQLLGKIVVSEMLRYIRSRSYAFFIMSSTSDVMETIEEHMEDDYYGYEFTSTDSVNNPNSDNDIRVLVMHANE